MEITFAGEKCCCCGGGGGGKKVLQSNLYKGAHFPAAGIRLLITGAYMQCAVYVCAAFLSLNEFTKWPLDTQPRRSHSAEAIFSQRLYEQVWDFAPRNVVV